MDLKELTEYVADTKTRSARLRQELKDRPTTSAEQSFSEELIDLIEDHDFLVDLFETLMVLLTSGTDEKGEVNALCNPDSSPDPTWVDRNRNYVIYPRNCS